MTSGKSGRCFEITVLPPFSLSLPSWVARQATGAYAHSCVAALCAGLCVRSAIPPLAALVP